MVTKLLRPHLGCVYVFYFEILKDENQFMLSFKKIINQNRPILSYNFLKKFKRSFKHKNKYSS